MKYLLIAIFSYSVQCSIAQSNLVLNPSFEEHDSCWPGIGGISAGQSHYWSSPNDGSSDYFSTYSYIGHDQCGYDSGFTTVPMSAFGFAYSNSGECYSGFQIVSNDLHQFREYIQGSFATSLLSGRTYPVELFISLTPFSICFSDIGFYFSDTQVSIINSATILPLTPQFENSPTNLINQFSNWQKVTGYYTAHGGENFLSIGCFKHTDSCHLVRCGIPSDTGQAAYLFIDDVAVYDTSKTDTIKLCMNDSVRLNGDWQHTEGLYFDTIGGLPVKFYIKPRPESASLTVIDKPFALGDSVKAAYTWVKNDTIIEVPKHNIYGCDSTVRYICRTNVGITPLNQQTLVWNVHPNPANDFFEITLSQNDLASYRIAIFDITGKMIIAKSLSSNKIDVTTLNKGMYFIKLLHSQSDEVFGVQKFVKE